MNRKRKTIVGVTSACKRFLAMIDDLQNSDSDSDSEDEMELKLIVKATSQVSPREEKIPRVENYFESVVPNYSDKDFKSHFRITRPAFQKLFSIIEPILRSRYEYGRPRQDIEKKLLGVLWLLATPDSYRSVGDKFGLGKSSLSDWFFRIIRAIYQIAPLHIKWPDQEEKVIIKEKFKMYANLPNAVGAVDGTFVPIKKPEKHAESYLTRKCYYAYTLQAIAEPSLKFTDCFCAYPGSVSDHRNFINSDIYKSIMENERLYFEENSYILGDKAYPLLKWCLTPYINRGNLTPSKIYFNEAHAKTRQVIERAFCLFFGRWRRFKYLDMNCTDLIPYTVIAACVLHNLCIHYDFEVEEYIQEGQAILEEIGDDAEFHQVYGAVNRGNEGHLLRDNISLQLFINRRR